MSSRHTDHSGAVALRRDVFQDNHQFRDFCQTRWRKRGSAPCRCRSDSLFRIQSLMQLPVHQTAGPPDRDERYGTTLNHRLMVGPTVISLVGDHVAGREPRVSVGSFGLEGSRAWRLCNGTGDEAIYPMAFVETVAERMSLSFPTSLVHAFSLAVDTLLRRAYARPEMRGRYAGRVSLRCDAPGWPSWERSISFREPAGTWESASHAVRSRLESAPPDTPVEEVAPWHPAPEMRALQVSPWTPRRGRPSGRSTRRSPWRSGRRRSANLSPCCTGNAGGAWRG